MPEWHWVTQDRWREMEPPFDKDTAMQVKSISAEEELEGDAAADNHLQYVFYINRDNVYLQTELKGIVGQEELTQERYKIGMVLIGLALLNYHESGEKDVSEREDNGNGNGEYEDDIETKVANVTCAIAPFLIPMITSLGELELPSDVVDGIGSEAA